MKSHEEAMKILEAFDLTGSYKAAARLCGCSHVTVADYVARRARGQLQNRSPKRRPSKIDPYRPKIEEWISRSRGNVRADICHQKLKAMGFAGSERTVRRVVAEAKRSHRKDNRRIFRPWVTEPGMWAQWDWGEGPRINGLRTSLFCAWLAWSRFRVVIPVRDRRLETVIACLDRAIRSFGGVPTYWLTDNEKTVTTEHIAGISVRHPLMVACGAHYGTTITTCQPADPQSKGGSEATVRIAKADLVPTTANLRPAYSSWAELVGACQAFTDTVNARQHRITAQAPDQMLSQEQSSLHPLPRSPFTVAFGVTRRANRTSLISFGGAQYSVPHAFADETVWVRSEGDELVVVAAAADGLTEVARHRCALPGRRVIDPSHFPAAPPGPLRRRPHARTKRERAFLGIGTNAERWLLKASQSGSGRIGAKLDEIVTLSCLHRSETVDRALGIAADHGRFGFGDIGSIIESPPLGSRRRAAESSSIAASTSPWKDFGTVNGAER